MLQAVVAAGAWADRVKRALFYGTPLTTSRVFSTSSLYHRPDLADLLHATLGSITESAEIAEHMRDVLTGDRPLDATNLVEEIGDVTWYLALALRSLGSDFETAFTANIAKLRARFPEKFTAEAAVTRNLVQERFILEQTVETEKVLMVAETVTQRQGIIETYDPAVMALPSEEDKAVKSGSASDAENFFLISVLDRILIESKSHMEAKRWAFRALLQANNADLVEPGAAVRSTPGTAEWDPQP